MMGLQPTSDADADGVGSQGFPELTLNDPKAKAAARPGGSDNALKMPRGQDDRDYLVVEEAVLMLVRAKSA